ncbi:hypothetical protein [Phormidium sp. CCY1219]|uniref:hypothetical protein n=1 Tax=Phormidium sp. CCY1219 TaxID=2886104 RepID=UPI002D78A364|nr:hypothetical protein [Phormidium sp. CCY1219]
MSASSPLFPEVALLGVELLHLPRDRPAWKSRRRGFLPEGHRQGDRTTRVPENCYPFFHKLCL